MKVICAPDSFKESLTAKAAAEAMARGVRRALPHAVIDLCPISDGGEGFVEAMVEAMAGEKRECSVTGPLPGQQVVAPYGFVDARLAGGDSVGVVEMASAAGLALVPKNRRDPCVTSTYGFGQLLHAAAEHADRLLVGIGGSATTDGGCGMAQAIGVQFFDASDALIREPLSGGQLRRIHRINLDHRFGRFKHCQVNVACDVTNPLVGPHGAAHIYGPQKGASPEQVEQLDAGLEHLANVVRDQLRMDVADTPGAGAAGGLGFGLSVFLGARMKSGIDMVLDCVQFNDRLVDADLVLTGEGKLDGQSLAGKACMGIAQRAKRQGVPTVALVGAVGEHVEKAIDAGLAAYAVIGEGLSMEESIRRADGLIESTAERICRERLASS